MNLIWNFISSAIGQAPDDAVNPSKTVDMRLVSLIAVLIVASLMIALLVWRSVIGWRHRIQYRRAQQEAQNYDVSESRSEWQDRPQNDLQEAQSNGVSGYQDGLQYEPQTELQDGQAEGEEN